MVKKSPLDELVDFKRLPNDIHKVKIAISRLENPYGASMEAVLAYQEYLNKNRQYAVKEFIDLNELTMLPKLVSHRVIKKNNVDKFADYARENRKFDSLSYLMNASNALKLKPKQLSLFKKYTEKDNLPRGKVQLSASNISTGDVFWMGENPLPWRVLSKSGKRLLIISEYVLETSLFKTDINDDALWCTSRIRHWLNGEFYENFLSDDEKSMIMPLWIDESGNTGFENFEGACENKAFILTKNEAEKYFKNDSDRRRPATLSTVRSSTYILFDNYATWWLRTPAEIDVYGHYHVQMSGDITMYGMMFATEATINGRTADTVTMEFQNNDSHGIRPAMYIRLDK
jgi:AAA15 family ATPase/GTPase